MSWLKQVLTQKDNTTYDGAYVALAALMGLAVFVVLNLLVMAWIDMLSESDRDFNYMGLGTGIAAIIGAIGGFLAGVGGFILMDRKGQAAIEAAPASVTTTEEKKTVVKTTAAEPANGVTDTAAGPGHKVAHLSPKIKPEHVGASVALVKPKKKGR